MDLVAQPCRDRRDVARGQRIVLRAIDEMHPAAAQHADAIEYEHGRISAICRGEPAFVVHDVAGKRKLRTRLEAIAAIRFGLAREDAA